MLAYFCLVCLIGRVACISEINGSVLALSNANLDNSDQQSYDDCLQSCILVNCVAFSWNGQTCLISMCNDLLLTNNSAWNTTLMIDEIFSISDTPPYIDLPLTDTCGSQNLGYASNITLNLTGTTYDAPVGDSAGNALTFAGTESSKGCTDSSSTAFNPKSIVSMTLMFWFNITQLPDDTKRATLLEFTSSQARGASIEFSLSTKSIGAQVFYETTKSNNDVDEFSLNIYGKPDTWNHITLVFDKVSRVSTMYLNAVSQSVQKEPTFFNGVDWDTMCLAKSSSDPKSVYAGSIYCLKVFSSALSPQEISEMMSACSIGSYRWV